MDQLVNLKNRLGSGLLSFPVTDFTDSGIDLAGYQSRVAWLSSYDVAGLFAAGGTGEFFSIGWLEYETVVRAAVEAAQRDIPIVAGVGYGTEMAKDMARCAQRAGAHGVLVLPHYLVEADQEGIARHLIAICQSVDIGVIYYARDNSRLKAEWLARVADACPNLIGYKDGTGDIQAVTEIVEMLGDRLVYIGGLPTAEVFASALLEIGVTTYSSAVFNFAPELALRFYSAVRTRDREVIQLILSRFFLPFVSLRERRAGYAVSLIKAGARIVGRPAGPVRLPLIDAKPDEIEILSLMLNDCMLALAACASSARQDEAVMRQQAGDTAAIKTVVA
jgi:5-dehydro-4-deoxyglucarate dehydratase